MRHTEPISFAALNSANVDTRPTAMGGRMTLENVPLDPRVEAKIARREAEANRLEAAMCTEGQPRDVAKPKGMSAFFETPDVKWWRLKPDEQVDLNVPAELDKAQRIRHLEHLRATDYSAYMRLGPDGLSPSDEHLRLTTGVDRVKAMTRKPSIDKAKVDAAVADIKRALKSPYWGNAYLDEKKSMTATEVRVRQEAMRQSLENIRRITQEQAKKMMFGDWRDQI